MEIFKPTLSTCGRAALFASAWLTIPLSAGDFNAASDLAGQELARRSTSIEEARELLRKGDEAYQAGRYGDAVEAYAGARDIIPNAPVSAELRAAATERYAQASVEHARMLSRKGDVAGAKTAVNKVLQKGVAPNDPGALAMRAQLDDPIRTNPALTKEHAAAVDSVRRLLYTAQGAFDLGKFDEAKRTYKKVLQIDPTNSAARRGMEQVDNAKSGYHNAAYDQTRAEMLGQVDAQWELRVPAPDLGVGPVGPDGGRRNFGEMTIQAKLRQIMISTIALDQATLDEALDFLRLRSAENDTFETDPARRGVNFTVNLGPPDSETAKRIQALRFDLQLSNIPLSEVLKHIGDITGTSISTDEFSVLITPAGSTSEELISRSFRVPPDFISSLSTGAGASEENNDPFAEAPSGGGLLTKRLSAQEALSLQGVSFPDGASASYSPATSTLRVINTGTNLDFISQIVETMSQTEPVMVAVRVTMIRTQQTNLEELGFDWLVTPFPVNGPNTVNVSGGTIGNTPGRTGADFISPVEGVSIDGVPGDPTGRVSSGVVTNGLRTGDQAIQTNNLDRLLNNPNRAAQNANVAPGVMSVTGLFTDGQVQMLMRGLDQKKGTDVLARPSTVTRSGQASNIAIVREFIYPSEYEPPELPNSVGAGAGNTPVTPATPTAFETKEVGITLEVLPVADANRRFVDITLNPSVTDFDGFVNYGSPINSTVDGILGTQTAEITPNTILMPVFSAQRAATQLTVLDGSTIVMGGLMTESVQNVEDKVPILGSLPWVGRLFSSKSRESVSTAVLFLVQVELLDPTGRPYRDR